MNRASPATVLLISAVGLLLLVPSSAVAHAGPHGASSSIDEEERAVDLLSRAALALEEVSYTGSRIVSSWGSGHSTTVLVDVTHVARQGTLVRMRGGGAAGGPDDTATFLAAGKGDSPQRPGLGVDSLRLLTDSYDVGVGAPGRVAGRTATVVEIGRSDRLVARIWVDDATGLPLRRELFDSDGRLVVESAFIDLTVEDGFIAHLPPTSPERSSDRLARHDLPGLKAHGWACPQQVGSLRLVAVERMDATSAVHMAYSDGLSRVSVFEQRGTLDEDSLSGFTPRQLGGARVHLRVGMPSYAVWEDSGTVYTVVSDAPVDTIGQVVASYPHSDGSGSGFWGRVGGGLARMGAWVTPLV